ncbi:DsbA family oxidoreductase [Kurthia zopfii]|uniref:DsbA family oxidoreductase n=1 Tax=Kurthia zopfii TaxID=1650 RepID=UPI000F6E4526|nr:DsbA family oxidoreductase [Kurthia zopfii]VEI05721.1 Protein-disulfide isomerase [Kurthia zopfii]
MKIEVWSDYACPFCYIGKRELENAIENTGFKGKVDVEFKAYQLDPGSPAESDETMYSALARKFGSSEEQAKSQTEGIKARAAEVGLNYDFDKMTPANTFKAHRLSKFAGTFNKEKEMTERLLKAYFEEGAKLGNTDVLVTLATEIGLDEKVVRDFLSDDQFATEVLTDIEQAREIGVQGVPFFVINQKYAISGAQPTEVFEQAVKQVAEEEGLRPGIQMMGSGDAGVCKDGQCEI